LTLVLPTYTLGRTRLESQESSLTSKGKIMKKVSFLILAFLMATGCSTTNKSALSAPISIAATTNLYANVDVGDKISGTSKASFLLGFLQLGGPSKFADGVFGGAFASPLDPTPSLKAAAAYNAMEDSGAEVFVNPQYVVTVKGFLIVTVTVDVTGYKGTIKGITDTGPKKE
jgi:hypothetical protein